MEHKFTFKTERKENFLIGNHWKHHGPFEDHPDNLKELLVHIIREWVCNNDK